MAAKKKTTSRVSNAFSEKEYPTQAEAKKAAAAATNDLGLNLDGTPKKDERGRPPANHGLTRTSILADKAQMQRLKVVAAKEGRHMYELHREALDAYLKGKG
jgi:hypothetical protein